MGEVKVSSKSPGYTKQATIWMRPETYRAIRVLAAQRETTIQSLIDQMIHREIRSEAPDFQAN